ncbi:bacillithiol biosynthesis cysteine-adding enzyme BshC [Cecembia sp.]|uniref:bacillithiol biosynthesis cysteine-adding enzyme BshC n=1 Tax=Cecembia sp. TaxID=1898110 RepID=UPI0025BCDC92|nr:bacillithiol biosynthesis cysteine-adding enzyme BshC [Cecembia sp.]
MIKSTVEPECTGQFSPLFLDYLRQIPELRLFYNQYPVLENFKSLINGKDFSTEKRDLLSAVLEKQYEGMELEEITKSQINSLRSQKTFTVTTGHQLNLFTGPLYFIYKIVSTVNLAERLSRAYPDYHFIPVYWLASEDHDFEEINYFKLDGNKYQWHATQTGPVGAFRLDESFKSFFKEVTHFVPDFFKEAYLGSKTLAEACRKYVHHLFGAKGLLIADGNDPALKSMFRSVLEADLIGHKVQELVQKTTADLEDLGYKSQIFPREINLFYMEGGIRERIEKSGGIYKVLNTEISFAEDGLHQLLNEHPERFSPNVVLRPIYQETILPNIAYLGGPAEVAYWLQLKPLFDNFNVQFPALMPRNFALILDHVVQRKIEKLGIDDVGLFQSVREWKTAFVASHAHMDIGLNEEKKTLEGLFDQMTANVSEVDKTLEDAFQAGKVRALKIMEQLASKVRKAEERKQSVSIGQRESIHAFCYPGGSPQERVENFMKFYLKNPNFLQELFEVFDPLDYDFMILKENNE